MNITQPADGARFPVSMTITFTGNADVGAVEVRLVADNAIDLGVVPVSAGHWTFVRRFSQLGVRTIKAIGIDANGAEIAHTQISIDLRLSSDFGYTPPEAVLHHLGNIAGLLEAATPIHHTFSALDHVKGLFRLPGGQFYFDCNLDLDTDGKATPGITFEHTHSPNTSLRFADGTSLEANAVPYVVLPGFHAGVPHPSRQMQIGGIVISLGDIAAILHGDHIEFAVLADFGPTTATGPVDKIGEGSIAVHRSLGHETIVHGHVHDTDIEHDVVTIVFPGSGNGLPQTPALIRQAGRALFTALGGVLP